MSKDLNSDLEHSCSKAQRSDIAMHTWTLSSGEVESGGSLGFCWPAGLAELVSSRFSEKPHLKE